jgi:hypothetical protein
MNKVLLSIKLFLCKISANPVFIIEVKNSQIRLVKGDVSITFLSDCEDIVRENKITFGLIYGVRNSDGKTMIRTSSEIASGSAQRIRNLWSFYS